MANCLQWHGTWKAFPLKRGWKSWVCLAWRRGGSGETSLQAFSTWRGLSGKRVKDFSARPTVRGQGIIVSCWKRIDLNGILFGFVCFCFVCLTTRLIRHWHRLPKEAVHAPLLGVFKPRLDGVWGNLAWLCPYFWRGLGAQEDTRQSFKSPFRAKPVSLH